MSKQGTDAGDRPALAIVGPGKVGTALAVLAGRCGWPVAAVGGRDLDKARAAAEAAGSDVHACSPAEAAAAGELILLTVSDEAIQSVCDELAAAGAFAAGSIVAHCCGALDSSVLGAARSKCACHIGSLHPLQTFPSAEAAVRKLPGAFFFCEADPQAMDTIRQFVEAIGGRPVTIPSGPGQKALYHAAAVMACNYLSALMDGALTLAGEAGIERQIALEALEPLVRATVDNVIAMGPQEALTGPIARGDADTVSRHLDALAGRAGLAEIAELYRAAGIQTVALALKKGTITDKTAVRLRKLLRPVFKER